MEKYLKKGLLACLLVFGMLVSMCAKDTLYAATRRVDHLEVYYREDADRPQVGKEIRNEYFDVKVVYDDDEWEWLGSREFELTIIGSDSNIIEHDDDVVRITYGSKWVRFELEDIMDNDQEEIPDESVLLSISATYDGDPVAVGGMASRRDFTVKATYRVYYGNEGEQHGSTGRKTVTLEAGWILQPHTITSGNNDLTITYSEKGVRKSCTVRVPSSGTKGNWVRDGELWRFQYDDSTYLTGDWIRSGGKWYYMDEYGYMLTRVKTIIDGDTYYFDDSGVMQTGWVYIGRNWYFFDSNGKMMTGWVYTGGYWYYMDKEGVMLTDWLSVDGKWYFLDSDGKMQTGWLKRSYTWFFLNPDGVMQTGWVYTGGKWYFMDHGGAMLTNTWVGNSYVDGSGAWVSSR